MIKKEKKIKKEEEEEEESGEERKGKEKEEEIDFIDDYSDVPVVPLDLITKEIGFIGLLQQLNGKEINLLSDGDVKSIKLNDLFEKL
jgi:hypothetical protein